MDISDLSIEYTPIGKNGRVNVTIRDGDRVLRCDKLDLLKAKDRQEFIKGLCEECTGLDEEELSRQFTEIAASLHADDGNGQPAANGPLVELDLSSMVRPDQFFTDQLTGAGVPILTDVADRPVGRWLLYLNWECGIRERIEMPSSLELPGGEKLWISPEPAVPTPEVVRELSRWSERGRKAWLVGEANPDPADVFHRLCEQIARFVEFPPKWASGAIATLAIWVCLTYCYQAWDAAPYLYVGGPKGSGKSRLFEILVQLVFRPLPSSNLTAPLLFRTLHSQGGVLLLDEAERLKYARDHEVQEVLSVLLAGYKRGSQVHRLESRADGTFQKLSFNVYGPKALACIAGLPLPLLSRCIALTMFRAKPNSPKPKRRIGEDPESWQRLRDDLHAMALNNGPVWLNLARRTDVCGAINGRDYEIWQPIHALAAWIEEHGAIGLLKLIQAHALHAIETGSDQELADEDALLLQLLTNRVLAGNRPTPGELLKEAREMEPVGFANWSAKGVASHLRSFGLVSKKSHGRQVYRTVTIDDLRQIQTNYGIDLGLDRENVPHVPHVPRN